MTRIEFDCDKLINLRLPPVHFVNFVKIIALCRKLGRVPNKEEISNIMRISSYRKTMRIVYDYGYDIEDEYADIFLKHNLIDISESINNSSNIDDFKVPSEIVSPLSKEIKKKDIFEYFKLKWNEFANTYSLPTVSIMTDARKNGVISRINQKGFDFDSVLDRISESRFLTGRSSERFRVSFDFIFLSPNKWVKILEGNYSEVKPESISLKNIFEESNES